MLPETRSAAPEIRALIAAFNRLQARLAQLLRARMAMLGGISHDVRTFATRLRLRVDHIPDKADRERAVADIDDMIRLLDVALRRVVANLIDNALQYGRAAHVQVEASDQSVRLTVDDEDLVALSVEAAAMAGVPLAGTQWIPGVE